MGCGWCGEVWYSVVWCGVVWLVWYGVVRCGVVWCGVVWRGGMGCGVVGCGVVKYDVAYSRFEKSNSLLLSIQLYQKFCDNRKTFLKQKPFILFYIF